MDQAQITGTEWCGFVLAALAERASFSVLAEQVLAWQDSKHNALEQSIVQCIALQNAKQDQRETGWSLLND